MMKKSKTKIVALLTAVALCGAGGALILSQANADGAGENQKIFSAQSATVTYDAALPSYVKKVGRHGNTYDADQVKGVLVQAEADVSKSILTYNKIIDVSKNTKDIPLIEFMITPQVTSENDNKVFEFRTFRIRLTDLYDEKNYVTITANRRPDVNYPSVARVGTANQSERGLVYSTGSFSGDFGLNMDMSFSGRPSNPSIGLYYINYFSIDYASRSIYCGKTLNVPENVAIKDLDDMSSIQSGEMLWNGFTTGECILSIELDKFNDNTALPKVMLFGVNGNEIENESLSDTTAPTLYLNDKFTENEVPFAEVNKAYPVPAVWGLDYNDGKIAAAEVIAKAFFDYGKETQEEVSVINGGFVPTKAGEYTIEYSAVDKAGNQGKYLLKVTAQKSLNPFELPIANQIKREFTSGEKLVLPETIVTGGAGCYNVDINLVRADGKKVELINGEAALDMSGKYLLSYAVSDWIDNKKTFTYDLTVIKRELPLIEDKFVARFALKGKPLYVPLPEAYDFASFDARRQISVVTYVGENGGEEKIIDEKNRYYTPESTGTLTVRYSAKNVLDGKKQDAVYSAEVVSPQRIGEYVIAEKGEASISYSSEETGAFYSIKGDTTLTFVNDIIANGMLLNFGLNQESENVKTVNLILQDKEVYGNKIVVSFEKASANSTFVSINGGAKSEFKAAPFAGDPFYLQAENGWLLFDGTKIIKMPLGGISETVFVSVEFVGVSGNPVVLFKRINNQPLSDSKIDEIGPCIVFDADIVKYATAGDKVFIPYARAVDVLDPVSEISLSVISPSGKVTAIENKAGGQYLTFNETGSWLITATAKDSSGNQKKLPAPIYVRQSEKPVLTIANMPSAVKKGETVKFAATVEKGLQLTVMVANSTGVFEEAKDETYTFANSGVYYVFFYEYDAETYAYNVKRFCVTVK